MLLAVVVQVGQVVTETQLELGPDLDQPVTERAPRSWTDGHVNAHRTRMIQSAGQVLKTRPGCPARDFTGAIGVLKARP